MKRTTKKHSKRLVLLSALALIGFGSVGATFAFWASSVSGSNKDNTNDIDMGKGETQETVVSITESNSSLKSGESLVPASYANVNDKTVGEVKITFKVQWSSLNGTATEGTKGQLNAFLTSITNSNNENVTRQFTVNFDKDSYSILSDREAVTSIATITMKEPENQAEYIKVANQKLSFKFKFKVFVF